MTEEIPSGEFKLPGLKTYEPKRVGRWVLAIDGIEAFVFASADRPKAVQNDHVITWCVMRFVVNDPIDPSSSKAVFKWLKSREKRDGVLKLLNSLGECVETWSLLGLELNYVNFGSMTYESLHPATIEFHATPTDVQLS